MTKRTLMFTRFSLFMVYFWFGILKVLNVSPAEQLVLDLFNQTLAWLLPFSVFYLVFSLFECILGVLFLITGAEKVAFWLMTAHIFTTALPLLLLPESTWSAVLVPTLTGQYILKNVLIVVMGLVVLEGGEQKKHPAAEGQIAK